MSKQKRHKAGKGNRYKGVYYVQGKHIPTFGRDKIFYISYYRRGKRIEEVVGRASDKTPMTSEDAAHIRGNRIRGLEQSNREKREVIAGRITFARLWEIYNERRRGGTPDVTDLSNWENHLEERFGKKTPSEVVPDDTDDLRADLEEQGLAPATVVKVIQLLNRLGNFGSKKRICPGLSFKPERPEVNNQRVDRLSNAQVESLYKALDDAEDQDVANIVRVALLTGMRRGELLKLEWRDIDWDLGWITLRDPKGKKDVQIPLNAPARDLLKTITRVEKVDGTPSPYVFPTRTTRGPHRPGEKRTSIAVAVNKIYEKANVSEGWRPLHSLRHHYASSLASNGVPIQVIKSLLTHKTLAMTDRYSHIADERIKAAAEIAPTLVRPREENGDVIPFRQRKDNEG